MGKHIATLIATAFVVITVVVILLIVFVERDSSLKLGNDFVVTEHQLRKYERIGISIWGQVCGGQGISMAYAPLRDANGRKVDGLASYTQTMPYSNCAVLVTNEKKLSKRETCAIVVHEIGHLDGRGHSSDPDSVMYRQISSRNIPRRCE